MLFAGSLASQEANQDPIDHALAVARGLETGAPTLVGLVSLYDPPRPDAKQLIATLLDLGVPVKMLTGDALPVACEIGQGVGHSRAEILEAVHEGL